MGLFSGRAAGTICRRRYDATTARFLPVISFLRAALLSVLLPVWGPAQGPGAALPEGVEVATASGEVRPAVLETVRGIVAERLAELRPVFDDLEVRPFQVRVHASRASLPDDLARLLHEDTAGFVLLGQREVHLVWGEMQRLGAMPRGVVAHELVHELLDQYVEPHGAAMPRWFHEGLAQLLAGETQLGAREEELLWRFGARRMLSFADLRSGFPRRREDLQAAYAQSYSYVSWLAREFGIGALLAVARNVDGETTFERALVGRTGRSTLQIEDAWRYHLLHGSGAPWRILLDQCFNLLLLLSLPLLVMAFLRRRARERRAAARLEQAEAPLPVVEIDALPAETDARDAAAADAERAAPGRPDERAP